MPRPANLNLRLCCLDAIETKYAVRYPASDTSCTVLVCGPASATFPHTRLPASTNRPVCTAASRPSSTEAQQTMGATTWNRQLPALRLGPLRLADIQQFARWQEHLRLPPKTRAETFGRLTAAVDSPDPTMNVLDPIARPTRRERIRSAPKATAFAICASVR